MQIYIGKSGQQIGPFTKEQLKPMLSSGMVGLADLAWHEGLAAWTPLHEVLELPPPIPPAPKARSVASHTANTPQIEQPLQHSGQPASYGMRFVAHIIDWIVAIAVTLISAYIAGFILGLIERYCLSRWDDEWSYSYYGALYSHARTTLYFECALALITFWVLLLYYALMESSSKQATLGKLACGLAVTDMQGQRIEFRQAGERFFSRCLWVIPFGIGVLILGIADFTGERIEQPVSDFCVAMSGITLVIGYLMCVWTKKRQCLHDILAKCLVLRKRGEPGGRRVDGGDEMCGQRVKEMPKVDAGKMAEKSKGDPEIRSRLLTTKDIEGWSQTKIRSAINWLYANRGFVFADKALDAHLRKKEWYKPNPALTVEVIEGQFSETEKANVKMLGEAREGVKKR